MMMISGAAAALTAGALFTMNAQQGQGAAPSAQERIVAAPAESAAEDIRVAQAETDAPETDAPETGAPETNASTGDDARTEEMPDAGAAAPSRDLNFTLGELGALRAVAPAGLMQKIEDVGDVASRTKVWVATLDVARAPGAETLYHVKGPLTCGRIGCDLLVVGADNAVLLETVGEAISSPQIDTLIINPGSAMEVTWTFDGAQFVRR